LKPRHSHYVWNTRATTYVTDLRNVPKYWCRADPHTQQERRLYHATLDQEMPIHVRAHRRPNHLPDSRAELHASSYTQFVCITRWLWKQVGKPWNEVFKAAGSMPTFKPAHGNRQAVLHAVHTQTYMRDGEIWAILPDGGHIRSGLGFLVDPATGRLTHHAFHP
jgi:hypothetical protein